MAPRNIAAPFIASVISAADIIWQRILLVPLWPAGIAGGSAVVRRKADLPAGAAMDKARVKDKTQSHLC
ncbi:MAG: hypothetical protein ACLSB9_37800 [Hydrogeniiclostridium mannosilyticum]